MQKLKGRGAIVTGGSRAAGRAIAERLSIDGAPIVIGYFSGEGGVQDVQLAAQIDAADGRAISFAPDVSKEQKVETLLARAIGFFGGVAILVNNAGVGVFGSLSEITGQDFDATYGLNAQGVLFGLKFAARPINEKVES